MTSSSRPIKARPIKLRLGLVFLVVALVASACSQSSSDDDTTVSAEDGASEEPGSEQPAEEAPEPSGDSDGGPAPAGTGVQGVTDEAITISFIITDTSAVAQAFGWETPDEGDREAQVKALVEQANADGGIGGRMIDARIHVFNAITDGPVAEEQLCNAITQDDQAFAAVLTGQFQENARPCYANANTLMLDATLYPIDNVGYEELAPYLWSPFLPSYDDLVSGLADDLLDTGWFDGATLGVIAIDSELSDRVYNEQFRPVLDEAGVEVASYNTIDPTDSTSFNNDQLQAIVNFKEAGVDKVVVIGGSRLLSWFIDTSITQNFMPAYAVTSYDAPDFNVFNYPEMMVGARGISVLPGFDVHDDQYPFPANDAEQACVDIFTEAGLEVGDRASVRTGVIFCDAVRLLAAAGEGLSEVSAQGVSEAVWALGDTFEAASVYGVDFSEGSYAGGAEYLRFAFDEACSCMAVEGEPIGFDG
ncbi:MAG: hypothetical protein ACR2PK_13590 [Acidimicrobiales bacterium]